MERGAKGVEGEAIRVRVERSSMKFQSAVSSKIPCKKERDVGNCSDCNDERSIWQHLDFKLGKSACANLINPISCKHGDEGIGYQFQVNNDYNMAAASITIPRNTYHAMIEILRSYHVNDGF